jgi:hypothetical protein
VTRLPNVEIVGELAGLFQLLRIGGGASRGIGVARADGLPGRGALESRLKIAPGQPDAGGEAVEQRGRFASAACGSHGLLPHQGFIEFRLQLDICTAFIFGVKNP